MNLKSDLQTLADNKCELSSSTQERVVIFLLKHLVGEMETGVSVDVPDAAVLFFKVMNLADCIESLVPSALHPMNLKLSNMDGGFPQKIAFFSTCCVF